MGPEVVLIIALCAGGVSLVSGGTSILSFYHVRKVSQNISKDTTDLTITEKITTGNQTKEKTIHIKTTDFDMNQLDLTSTETGRENNVASTLAGGAAGTLEALTGGGGVVQEVMRTAVEIMPSKYSNKPMIRCTSDSKIEILGDCPTSTNLDEVNSAGDTTLGYHLEIEN